MPVSEQLNELEAESLTESLSNVDLAAAEQYMRAKDKGKLHIGRRQSDVLTAACFAAARASREQSVHSLAMMYRERKHQGNAGGLARHFDMDYGLPSFRTRSLDDPDIIIEESEPSNDSQSPTSLVSPVTYVTQTTLTSPLSPPTPVNQTNITSHMTLMTPVNQTNVTSPMKPMTSVNQTALILDHHQNSHSIENEENDQELKYPIILQGHNQCNSKTVLNSTAVNIAMPAIEDIGGKYATTGNVPNQKSVNISNEPWINRRPKSLGQELKISEKLADDQGFFRGNKTPSPTKWSLPGCLTPQDSPKHSPRNLSPRASPRSVHSFRCISPSITPEGSREELLQVTSL